MILLLIQTLNYTPTPPARPPAATTVKRHNLTLYYIRFIRIRNAGLKKKKWIKKKIKPTVSAGGGRALWWGGWVGASLRRRRRAEKKTGDWFFIQSDLFESRQAIRKKQAHKQRSNELKATPALVAEAAFVAERREKKWPAERREKKERNQGFSNGRV